MISIQNKLLINNKHLIIKTIHFNHYVSRICLHILSKRLWSIMVNHQPHLPFYFLSPLPPNGGTYWQGNGSTARTSWTLCHCTMPFHSARTRTQKAETQSKHLYYLINILFHIFVLNILRIITCNQWNFWSKKAKLNTQIIIVRTLSNTMRVVAEISFVTLIPAKLKKAIETIVPEI